MVAISDMQTEKDNVKDITPKELENDTDKFFRLSLDIFLLLSKNDSLNISEIKKKLNDSNIEIEDEDVTNSIAVLLVNKIVTLDDNGKFDITIDHRRKMLINFINSLTKEELKNISKEIYK